MPAVLVHSHGFSLYVRVRMKYVRTGLYMNCLDTNLTQMFIPAACSAAKVKR